MDICVKFSENGQITLPLEIQRQLGLKAGDEVKFYTNADGEIIISNASALIPQIQEKKPVKTLAKDASFEEIQEYLDCYKSVLTSRYPDKQMLLVFSYSEGKDYKIKFITTTPEEFLRAEYFTVTEKSTASRHVKKDAPKVYKLRWTNVKTKKNGQPSFLLRYGIYQEREILPEMDADAFLNGYMDFISKNKSPETAKEINDSSQLTETVGHYIEFLVLQAFGQSYTANFKSAKYGYDAKLNNIPYEIKSCLGKLKDSKGNSWNFGGSSVEFTAE